MMPFFDQCINDPEKRKKFLDLLKKHGVIVPHLPEKIDYEREMKKPTKYKRRANK